MTITNGYTTLGAVKGEMGISDSSWDTRLETAIEAASRQIDGHCGRRFWQDSTVQTREFYADSPVDCFVDDVSTTTGLVVKIDDDDDGTFETTLTITTHFLALPINAADESPARPFTRLRVVDSAYRFPCHRSGRPGVQVTAKFGWATVPVDVEKACITQAVQLAKASDAPFGGVSFLDGAVLRVRETVNPIAAALLEPYCLPRVA